MVHTILRLFGPPQVERDGRLVTGFESRKALALLGYLALHAHPLPRAHLVATFWGMKNERRGRGNLRRVLTNLVSLVPDCLVVERYTVGFRHHEGCWVDAHAFEQLIAQREMHALHRAAEIYRGSCWRDFRWEMPPSLNYGF